MYKIGLTALALLIATPALAEREKFTLKQLTPQVKTYLQRGWEDNVQRCFFGEIAEMDGKDWVVIADDQAGSLTAVSKQRQSSFTCDPRGFTNQPPGGKKSFVPHAQMWYNVD